MGSQTLSISKRKEKENNKNNDEKKEIKLNN